MIWGGKGGWIQCIQKSGSQKHPLLGRMDVQERKEYINFPGLWPQITIE